MASPKRIVLVDPRGEVLFSGESVIAKTPAEETCPETKRSAESGLFPASTARSRRSAPDVTEVSYAADGAGDVVREQRDPRAA